jgi:hypothetical protein
MMEIKITIEAAELSGAIFALADALVGRDWKPTLSGTQEKVTIPPEVKPAKVEKPAPEPEEKPAAAYTLEQVREKVLPLSEKNGAAWLKEILVSLGSTSLSKLDKAKYGELLEKAGAL